MTYDFLITIIKINKKFDQLKIFLKQKISLKFYEKPKPTFGFIIKL